MSSIRCLRTRLMQLRPPSITQQRAYTSSTKLPGNEHIYAFPIIGQKYLLTLLPTNPPTPSLALGTATCTTTSAQPIHVSPASFTENPAFLRILQSVLSKFASSDPEVKAQAATFASHAGSTIGSGGSGGSGGMAFPSNHPSQRREKTKKRVGSAQQKFDTGGAGGASAQGGMGGAGRGGWLHVSDLRNPPDYGRIAWPEDMFGSLEVDSEGNFVAQNGNYQESGTYRIVTNEGILRLPEFLHRKLVERLQELEKQQ